MEKMFTRDLMSLEQEATSWLEFFDSIPDDNFIRCQSSVDVIAGKLKAYARVYHCFGMEGKQSGYIIN